jgi:hypothetical protein
LPGAYAASARFETIPSTISAKPVKERKERLHALLSQANSPLQYSDHQIGRGRAFYDQACALKAWGNIWCNIVPSCVVCQRRNERGGSA